MPAVLLTVEVQVPDRAATSPDALGVTALIVISPLSYEVNAFRSLLLAQPGHLWLDLDVLLLASALGASTASALVGLAREPGQGP